MTAIAAKSERLLAALTPNERDALGRGHLQVELDRAAIVEVAASPAHLPFWLSDQGFVATSDSVMVRGERWPLYRKLFEAGLVGARVNALDRAGAEHYVPFFRAAEPGKIPPRSSEATRSLADRPGL